MCCWTDDPVRDFDRWDREMEQKRERCRKGKCIHCGEPVYDYEDYYDLYDSGDLLHEECFLDWGAQYKH